MIKYLLYGPCKVAYPNAICIVDGIYNNQYLYKFSNKSILGDNGYPLY